MYPCPCGWYGDALKECTCSKTRVLRCQKRTSGPLLDLIDLHIAHPRVDYEKLAGERMGEPSEVIRGRIETAHLAEAIQYRSSGQG